jgi:hypothetical protein
MKETHRLSLSPTTGARRIDRATLHTMLVNRICQRDSRERDSQERRLNTGETERRNERERQGPMRDIIDSTQAGGIALEGEPGFQKEEPRTQEREGLARFGCTFWRNIPERHRETRTKKRKEPDRCSPTVRADHSWMRTRDKDTTGETGTSKSWKNERES